jgi:hypothetical protein
MPASDCYRPHAPTRFRLSSAVMTALLAGLIGLLGSAQAAVIDPLTGELVDKLPPRPPEAVTTRTLARSIAGLNVAGGLYGTNGSTLYLLDKTTGAVVTTIGNHGLPAGDFAIGDLAFAKDGQLYGTSLGSSARLFRIDTSTGAATAVGAAPSMGLDFVFEGGLEFICDTIRGANELDLDTAEVKTFTASTSTGLGTRVGPMSGESRDLNGMAYDGQVLWAIDRRSNTIGKVDFATGDYDEIHAIPVKVGGVPIDIGNTGGLAFDRVDGKIYMVLGSTGALYTINPTTGEATLKGSTGPAQVTFGIAVAPVPAPTPTPVGPTPTPSPSRTPPAPLDNFLLYKIKNTANTPKLPVFGPISLTDSFGTHDYDVKKLRRLGPPANRENNGIHDPNTELVEYQIKAHAGSPKVPKGAGITLTDFNGQHTVGVLKPDSILVPTNLSFTSFPGSPTPATSNVDHFLCYKVLGPKLSKPVHVQEQFEDRSYLLTKLTRVCNPVTKSGTPTILRGPTKGTPFQITGSARRNPQRLVCYSARSTTKHVKRSGIFLANQFGHQRVDTLRESELCVPSVEPAGPTPTPAVSPTPTKTPTPPGPCQTPSPTPIYGSASKAFLATSKGLLD